MMNAKTLQERRESRSTFSGFLAGVQGAGQAEMGHERGLMRSAERSCWYATSSYSCS